MTADLLGPLLLLAASCILIFKPLAVAKILGDAYWHSGKLTALGKSDETKKYFYSQNPFWFRVLGFLLAVLSIYSVFIRF